MPCPDVTELVVRLIDRRCTVATCESLTGGLIGAELTSVPGSSAAFRGGLVTYASDLKVTLAGVDADVVRRVGVIDEQTAIQMALGARRVCRADLGVAVTGVAGPDGQDGHPPGEVWLAVAGPGRLVATTYVVLPGDRGRIRQQVVRAALWLLDDALGQMALSRGTGGRPGHPAPE